MSIVRLRDGSLVFYNAVPLDEATLAEVRGWGKPTSLIITHSQHGIDAVAFADTLGLKRYGPRTDMAELQAKFVMAGALQDLPTDDTLSVEEFQGTKKGEAVAQVRSGARVTVLFSDVYQDHSREPFNPMMWLMGFAGGPKVVRVFRWFLTSDVKAMKAHLLRIAELPGLSRILPSHGAVVEQAAAEQIRSIAAPL